MGITALVWLIAVNSVQVVVLLALLYMMKKAMWPSRVQKGSKPGDVTITDFDTRRVGDDE